MLSLLVAMDKNNVIGYNNDLPWRLPRDLKFFKEKTIGGTVVMGRATYDSIGKPLPKRKNVVITTKNPDYPEEVELIHNIDTLKEWNEKNFDEEYFIIGGGEIFRQVMDIADRMYITKIEDTFKGDTFFPEFNEEDWNITKNEKGVRDENNPYEYYFLQYDRK